MLKNIMDFTLKSKIHILFKKIIKKKEMRKFLSCCFRVFDHLRYVRNRVKDFSAVTETERTSKRQINEKPK